MKLAFEVLYAIHPWLPAIYLLLMANGLFAPAIYCALKRLPFSISQVLLHARGGSKAAKYVVVSYAIFLVSSILVLAAMLLR